jgi:hypothetical protein
MKRMLWVALAAAFWFAVPQYAGARHVQYRETLRGLPGVHVLVEQIPDQEIQRRGLTVEYLKTQVELRLRSYGITVLDEEQCLQSTLGPYLYVNVNIIVRGDGLVAYSVSVGLKQTVTLGTNGNTCSATTWLESSVGMVGLDSAREAIDRYVRANVDMFVNDFLAVNPPARR